MKKKLSREQTTRLIHLGFDFTGYPAHEFYGDGWHPIYDLNIGEIIEAIKGIGMYNVYLQIIDNHRVFLSYQSVPDPIDEDILCGEYETNMTFGHDNGEMIDNLFECLCWCLENVKGGWNDA